MDEEQLIYVAKHNTGDGDVGGSEPEDEGKSSFDIAYNGDSDDQNDMPLHDLIHRYRPGAVALNKKRDRAISPSNDARHDSPKRRSLIDPQEDDGEKFQSAKEPEEKKPRSCEPGAAKTHDDDGGDDDSLHDPEDLNPSHDDPGLSPSLSSRSYSEDDLDAEADTYKNQAKNYKCEAIHDLDSSGSTDEYNLLQSGSFNDPASNEKRLSLADELREAYDTSSSEDSSDEHWENSELKSDPSLINLQEYDSTEEQDSDGQGPEQQHQEEVVNLIDKPRTNNENQSESSSPEQTQDLVTGSSETNLPQEVANVDSSEDEQEDIDETDSSFKDDANDAKRIYLKTEKEKESSLDGTDLDFSVLQTSQQLNVDVTKQRISLRQKGSLARRRRPTRTSVRAVNTNSEMSFFRDSTEPRRDDSPSSDEEQSKPLDNGRVIPRRQEVMRSKSVPAVRSNVQLRTAPVLLPGLGDPLKRRSILSKIPDSAEVTSNESTPAWLAEVRVRRNSRSIKPDSEHNQSEVRNPESPSWMRDALSKKKRAADIIDRRAASQPVEIEQPSVPPWMKELRRTPHHHTTPTASTHTTHHTTNNNQPQNEAVPIADTPETPPPSANTSNGNTTHQHVSSRLSFGSYNGDPRTRSQHREVLAPLKRSSVDNSSHQGVIDNRLASPPSYLGSTNGQPAVITPNRNMLPPLKGTTQSSVTSQDDQENSESPIPAWKREMAARRKSKTFVPTFKAEVAPQIGDVPAWKRALVERNKIKKRDSFDVHTVAPSAQTGPSITAPSSPSLLPWQLELAQRRKRTTPSITRQPTSETTPNGGISDVPCWARNVERRRARLADSYSSTPSDCGLIPENSISDKSG